VLQSAKDEAAAKAPASVDPVTRAAAPHVPPPLLSLELKKLICR